jgi:hypothetical protein
MMMSVVRSSVLAGVLVGCMSPVMTFGGGKTPRQAQHEVMSDLAPVQIATERRWSGEITTRKIRVWADDQYRAQNIRWQQSFQGPLELANLVLTSQFGLRLVPEFRAWERHVPGSTIADDLEALAQGDPGTGVFLVVGLTSALPLVSATFADLGYASVGGRHLIVRGYANLEERKLYADAFRDLTSEERELALLQRREHKGAIVLLHEIAHALGADHDPEEHTIMSASYSHRAGSFSAQAREGVLQTLDQRLDRRPGRGSGAGDARETTAAAASPPPRPSGPPGRLVFHVTPSGGMEIEGKAVDTVDVDNLLEDAFAQRRDTEVVIMRSRKAPADALARIVDRATAIGLKVSISMY